MLVISRWKIIAVILAVVFGLAFTLTNIIPQSVLAPLPAWLRPTLSLGLDLQGGSYLLLEVDTDELTVRNNTQLVEDTRTQLREAQILTSSLGQVNGVVTVQITDPARFNEALNILRRLNTPLPTGGNSLNVRSLADNRIELSYTEAGVNANNVLAVSQSIEIVRRRIDALGTKEPTVVRQGTNRIVVAVPGESDPERLKNVIGKTARLTFQMVDDSQAAQEALVGGRPPPPGSEILPSEDGSPMVVRRRAVITGEMLTQAALANDPQTGAPQVAFRFNGAGTQRFADTTRHNVGKLFAIVLDGKIISAPVIQVPILNGSGVISGNFTTESANELAILLKAGALPAKLNVEEQRTIGAELGADAVRAGQISTAVGFVAILIFMVLAYGFIFGGISVVALLVNGALIIATMSVTGATLTLPGVAGLILTLAVAVDANVLIYERIRDEVRAGRSIVTAMDAGFNRAMTTIIDANVTTLLAALIMFIFGAGPVRGFAWTLSIGVLTSVFTAVVITQLLLAVWYRARRPKLLPIV